MLSCVDFFNIICFCAFEVVVDVCNVFVKHYEVLGKQGAVRGTVINREYLQILNPESKA